MFVGTVHALDSRRISSRNMFCWVAAHLRGFEEDSRLEVNLYVCTVQAIGFQENFVEEHVPLSASQHTFAGSEESRLEVVFCIDCNMALRSAITHVSSPRCSQLLRLLSPACHVYVSCCEFSGMPLTMTTSFPSMELDVKVAVFGTRGVDAHDALVSTPSSTFHRHPHRNAHALCSMSPLTGTSTYARKSWGGHPRCDLAPLTTSFGTVGQWERQHLAMAATSSPEVVGWAPPV